MARKLMTGNGTTCSGTLNMSDGGDFGGPPISTLHSPMYGSCERVGPRTFETTHLFMEADLAGVVQNIQKVHLTLKFHGNDFDHLTGLASRLGTGEKRGGRVDCPLEAHASCDVTDGQSGIPSASPGSTDS